MFREFKYKRDRYVNKNYNKYYRLAMRDMVAHYDIKESELNFLIFAYDYEFFTLDHMCENYFYSKSHLERRIVYPLQSRDYIFKYYDRLKPNKYEDAMFDERKMNYRVRYAISQKSRLLVQRFYRKLEGEEQINVPI